MFIIKINNFSKIYYEESNIFNKNEKYLKKSNKIYGFINRENNCYLNSSLQLLTRIHDLKEKILNYDKIYQDNIIWKIN